MARSRAFITIIFCVCGLMELHAKEISLSFDDAPRDGSQYFTGIQRSMALLKSLKDANVRRVAFYLNPVRMNNSEGIDRVKSYQEIGDYHD